MSQSKNNKPVSELRDGSLKIAIFRNEPKEEGDRARYSGKLTRSYKDASGDWQDTEYLSGTEYLRAANLLNKAYDQERSLRTADATQDSPEPNIP